MIRMWRFEDAPDEFCEMSGHGGDEDWVVHIPKAYRAYYMPWFEGGGRGTIGVCDISEHEQPDGSVVLIGAHA